MSSPSTNKPKICNKLGIESSSLKKGIGEFLPHWSCKNAIYHISFRLFDSVPQSTINKWQMERKNLIEHYKDLNNEISQKEKHEIQFLFSEKIEEFLDTGYGNCFLALPRIAELVVGSLQYFDGQRYHLHAWCIMPNHVHVIVEPISINSFQNSNSLSLILHSWKSYTAHQANKILNRTGPFWQNDYYNHIIRSEKSYYHQLKYIYDNPDEAGIKNWPWRWKKC